MRVGSETTRSHEELAVAEEPKTPKRSCLGLNLESVHCPGCQERMPAIRLPKDLQQLMWGGWTCPGCKTRMDKWGQPLK